MFNSIRVFSCITIALLVLILFMAQANADSHDKTGPNIIFILADDLGWSDVGYNGSKWVETPYLDKLATQSAVFNNAYMYPTCSPSRAAILTGKQSFRTQVYGVPVLESGNAKENIFSRGTVQKEHVFYSEPLNQSGYKLLHLGKWHVVGPNPEVEVNYPFTKNLNQPKNGDLSWLKKHQTEEGITQYYPLGRGFHKNVGGTWWGDPARGYDKGYQSASGGYIAPFKNPFIAPKKSDSWLTDRLTDEAIDFIANTQGAPFFINLNYYAPHRPSVPRTKKWLEKYQQKNTDILTGKNANRLLEMAAYGTMVESLDENIGRLLAFLDEKKLREQTVIIFASDNGFNSIQTVDDSLRGYKGSIYEGGIKVPALISWPGTLTPKTIETPISAVDYFPTILDIAGIYDNYDGVLDGISTLPLAHGAEMISRPLFWHVASRYKHEPVTAIRAGYWKLIQFLNSGKVELYHLGKDPRETTNLAKVNVDKTNVLLKQIGQWRNKNNVPLPPISNVVNSL